MDKGNIKLSLISFIFAAAVLGSGMQVGAAEYYKSLSDGYYYSNSDGYKYYYTSTSKGFTDLSAEKLTAQKVSFPSGAYDLTVKDLYLSNSPGVELKVNPLTSSKATPYFIVKSNKSLFNVLQMQVNSKNKKISIKMKNNDKQYKVSKLIIEVYAPVKAVSCEGKFNVDVTSNSISDFSLKSEGEITGTLNIKASASIDIHSEGEINLKFNGSTDKLKCKLEGEGTLDAVSLKTHECKLKLEGEGSVSVYADKSLKVKAEGEWKGSYAGNPKSVDIDPEGECVFKKL